MTVASTKNQHQPHLENKKHMLQFPCIAHTNWIYLHSTLPTTTKNISHILMQQKITPQNSLIFHNFRRSFNCNQIQNLKIRQHTEEQLPHAASEWNENENMITELMPFAENLQNNLDINNKHQIHIINAKQCGQRKSS